MTTAITQAGEKQRTTVRVELRGDPWPVIDHWGKATGYDPQPASSTPMSRLYQKGSGFWVAPQMLAAQIDGNVLTLQAWIRGTFIARLFSFFILPAEIRVASGGITAALPRKMARGDINKLLQQLGAPPIT